MALQGRAWETTVRLMDSGLPVTGVLFSAVSVKFRRSGESSFTTKTLIITDWEELSNGFYALVWSESDMADLGEFRYFLAPATSGFDEVTGTFDIDPVPLSVLAAPEVCIVSGNVVHLNGDPATCTAVVFRIVKTPSVVSSSLVDGSLLRTTPDAFGNFSVVLLRGKKVIVEIERSGIKHTITVPEQATADLVDLLPPIVD